MNQNIQKQVNYLLKITDNIGLIEHCHLDKPNYTEGYCVDDNARALQVCLRFKADFPSLENAIPLYYHFLKSAFKKNILYNDLNSNQTWEKKFEKNGEHLGRTLSALGEVIKFEPILKSDATIFFNQLYSVFNSQKPRYIRVVAQIISGLQYYRSNDIKPLANLLISHYQNIKTDSWNWFETNLSYDNARLPLALLIAYQSTSNRQYLQIALESLDFLTKLTFDKKLDYFMFPGNKGVFGQQPIEAGSASEAYSLAFHITQKPKYKKLALKAFDWYHGKNILGTSLINPKTGGIYDGLEKDGVNLDQGAESILSYLLAYKSIKKLIPLH